MSTACYVEQLTLGNWFFQILPRLIRARPAHLYVFDARGPVLKAAQATGRCLGIPVEKLNFRLADIRDEENLLVRERIPARDMWEIWNDILQNPFFRELQASQQQGDRLATFLMKNVTCMDRFVRVNLFRVALLVQIIDWIRRREAAGKNPAPEKVALYLIRRPWRGAIARYAARFGIQARFQLPMLRPNLRSEKMKRLYQRWLAAKWFLKYGRAARKNISKQKNAAGPKLIAQYYSRLNLDRPELFSDLFFWQRSDLKGGDVAPVFTLPLDPVDIQKREELFKYGMHPIVLHPKASAVPEVRPFRPRLKKNSRRLGEFHGVENLERGERRWLKSSLRSFEETRAYWRDVFEKSGGKIYVTWYRYDSSHCAIAQAIREVGGVLALYQWAMDTSPLIDTLVDSDVVFGYSHAVAGLEKRTGSKIPYFVITGFLGDHRFELLKPQAQAIRQKLMSHGARHILAFLDENSGSDSRWHTGHEFMRVNYQFLLEKVLENPWLGLVMKPKTPMSIRQRLGPVLPLLERALATGRAHMYEAGPVLSYYPPSAAAVGADIAIHGCLAAMTAGLECALAGVPTLLLDRESWPVSPLYRLGEGRVVFKDWPSLWEKLDEHWNRPGGLPGFGDWSPMIAELDPFRDGRAASRMGTYLMWLMEGFKSRLPREKVLEEAAARYREQWGADKVVAIG